MAELKITADYKLQQQLQSKLRKARLYLDDAENRQLGNKDIKEWLDDLKHLLFLADDLSDEIRDTQNRKSLINPALKPIYQSLSGTVRGELDEILMELDGLLDRVGDLGLKHCDATARDEGSSSTTNMAPLRQERRVFGRKDDKDKILELLLSDEAFGSQQIGVVPIVGMGGIGKTTLAHLAYNDTRVKPEFQLRAWVTVSTDFDICKILKSILEKISPGAVGTGGLYQLQEKMEEALSGKKFLIVLDDVWDESYDNWNLLKSNFEWGVLGSRVVVTTRSVEVGKTVTTGPIHELRKVSSEDCWSIFIDHAFRVGDSNSYPLLHKIGREIVKKCDGLPLAVMVMGGLLCSKRDPREWENVLKHPVWNSGENNPSNRVLPSLWLSYRYLPSSVKQCFAYCSVFPQDYEFDKEQMVLLWMAEGFLPSGKTETRSMEEVGAQYFDILVSRSLFQRSSIDESMFVMHDLIHDLAAFVSGAFCVSVANEDVKLKHVTVRTRHLSHDYFKLDSKLLSGVSEAKHLRTFLCQDYGMSSNDEFVKKLTTNHRRLRALSMHIRDPISASFCNLKNLRFLNLSGCKFKEVPSSVCTLFNLQTLILSKCSELTQLPTDITKLIKLRHLDISYSRLIKHMPPHMGNLKELRTLTHFIVGDPDIVSACSNIKEMQELQHLSGTLSISGLENAAKFQDVGKDILRHKANLKELVLKCSDTSIGRREDKEVLDALQPHTNLERLVIEGALSCFALDQFPMVRKLSLKECGNLKAVTNDGNSKSLTEMQLKNCPELESLLGLPKSLTHLEIWRCPKLVAPESRLGLQNLPTLVSLAISHCNCKSAAAAMSSELFAQVLLPSSLASLQLIHLRGFKSVNGSAFQQAKSLTTLYIFGCNELESLPEEELPSSLSTLDIGFCGLLERKYHKSKGDESYQHISHIPQVRIRGRITNEMDHEEEQ